MVDMDAFSEELNRLFEEGKVDGIEPHCLAYLHQAEHDGDIAARIQILNEMMGFYRETSQYEKSLGCIDSVLALIEEAELTDSIPHAITLENAANALRAAGETERSMEYYTRVFQLFEGRIPERDFRYAELYNNVALLYQELGRFDMASGSLQNALVIARETPGQEFKVAVTLANLGNSRISENKMREAEENLREAVEIFKVLGAGDSHVAAALTGLGEVAAKRGEKDRAREYLEEALTLIEASLGRTEAYDRVNERLQALDASGDVEGESKETISASGKRVSDNSKTDETKEVTAGAKEVALEGRDKTYRPGLLRSREFYETYGKTMIHEKFPAYEERIAVGFCGEGSDRFGFDDAFSGDHDAQTGFCMWLTDADADEIGKELQAAYEELTKALPWSETLRTEHSKDRLGVCRISDYYRWFTGNPEGPQGEVEWTHAGEERLAAAVNGEVFRDDLGEFTRIRNHILDYYPDSLWLRLLAQTTSLFGQYGQYNYARMALRGDWTAAHLMRAKAMEYAMHTVYLLNRTFRPHDKWLFKGLDRLEKCDIRESLSRLTSLDIHNVEENRNELENIAVILVEGMVAAGDIYPRKKGDILYLETYGEALAMKANDSARTVEELAEEIAKLEFAAFDQVKNEGGRAGCQDDWITFRIMRVSQYRTWTKEMLLRYLMDFRGALADGWNMITEKYGRMMESTAPESYAALAGDLPPVTEEQRAIVDEICKIQVAWMEEFKENYPKMAGNARRIRTEEDTPWDTSYETYLRGELLTYSHEMLLLYGRFVTNLASEGKNLTRMIMEQTAHLYGYESLDDAEAKIEV